MNNKKAFTLIEMLVVIAIIGILASMLMPSLMKALESSRKIVCMNNLKQIGLGYAMYVNDWNNRTWKEDGGGDALLLTKSSNDFISSGILYGERYLQEPGLFYCPSSGTKIPAVPDPANPPAYWKGDFFHRINNYRGTALRFPQDKNKAVEADNPKGGQQFHQDGYNGLFLDGSVVYVFSPSYDMSWWGNWIANVIDPEYGG